MLLRSFRGKHLELCKSRVLPRTCTSRRSRRIPFQALCPAILTRSELCTDMGSIAYILGSVLERSPVSVSQNSLISVLPLTALDPCWLLSLRPLMLIACHHCLLTAECSWVGVLLHCLLVWAALMSGRSSYSACVNCTFPGSLYDSPGITVVLAHSSVLEPFN